MAEISRPTRRASRRTRWLAAMTGAMIIAAGGAAVAGRVWDGGGATATDSVGCYASADLNADTTFVGTLDEDPIKTCADIWREGAVESGVTKVPPLVSCLTNDGSVGVFPGDENTCADLGLRSTRDASPEERAEAIGLRNLRDDLVIKLNAGCVPKDEAVRMVELAFAEHGLKGWKVNVPPDYAYSGPCASFGMDQQKKEIFLVGMPGADETS